LPCVLNVATGKTPFLNVLGTDWGTEDGAAVRDFIHIIDLAQAHVVALRTTTNASHSDKDFRTLNIGTGLGHSVLEVVAAMEKVSGKQIPIQSVGKRDGDVGICVADVSRAEKELSWKAKLSLQTACHDLWRFSLRARDELKQPENEPEFQ
jgi:UDP-glucose 4-epimerase